MEHLIDTKAAAAMLGIAPTTLETWRALGRPAPAFVKVGKRAVRYAVADVVAFIEANRRGNLGGAA